MAAPKGNQFTKKWTNPEDLQKDIDGYFKDCEEKKRPLTITGLALALDTNRQTLLNYENDLGEGFDTIIKKAKMMVHNFVEEYLFTGKNVSGAIFNLKNNYGWKDTTILGGDKDNPLSAQIVFLPEKNGNKNFMETESGEAGGSTKE